jgi:VCBS repeat-containing protein
VRRTANATESAPFFSRPAPFRTFGLSGWAVAILASLIEAATLRATEAPESDHPASDALSGASSTASPTASHVSNSGASAPSGTPGHSLGSVSAHGPDTAIFAAAPSIHEDRADGGGHVLANDGTFWFDAHSSVHISPDAEDNATSTTGDFSTAADASANISVPIADIVFTGAEASSFDYNGPGILDTAPGGAHARLAELDPADATIAGAHLTSSESDFGLSQSTNSLGNIPPILGSLNQSAVGQTASQPAASVGTGTAPLHWNGDLGSGLADAGSSGGGASGGSGILAEVPGQASAGLVINIVYDASVANAPAGFTQAVANVVSFYESEFTNPVTITIDVGYGEIDGQALQSDALGESQAYLTSVSYAQLQAALANNASAIGDSAAAANLPTNSPVDGDFWVTTAEAKALGLTPNNDAVDGYAGFSNIANLFDYDATNASGSVAANQYDFFGVVAHEFSEIMGRSMMDGQNLLGDGNDYEPLDLFHYSAPTIRDFSGTRTGYISPDGGTTNLDNLNTNPNGDFGDWAASAGNDSYDAYSSSGVLNPVSTSDLATMNLLGWGTSSPTASTAPTAPTAPIASTGGASGSVPPVSIHIALDSTAGISAASGVLANAADFPPGDALSVSAVDGSAANVGVGIAGGFGVLTLNADGSYDYSNDKPVGVIVNGGAAEDSFNFTVSDGEGDTADSTLTILITSPHEDYVGGASGSTIHGPAGRTVLDGSADDMTVVAGPGNHQILVGGAGDTLVGGSGKDTFMFAPDFGNETIARFHANDVIDLPESLFSSFAAVRADIEAAGNSAVIALDANDAITLGGFPAAQLHAHNFHFLV